MKRTLLILSLAVLSSPVFADFQRGHQTVAVFGGVATSRTQLDFRPLDGSKGNFAGPGGAGGAQYLYYWDYEGITWAAGVDVLDAHLSERNADLLPNYRIRSDAHFTVAQALFKIVYPKGPVRPYLAAGLGAHRTALFLAATPRLFWTDTNTTDTGTSEERLLLDSSRISVAVSYAVGLDWFPIESFFVGAEYRGYHLAKRRYPVEETARVLGFSDLDGNLQAGLFLVRVGVKFGAILAADSSHPVKVVLGR